MLNGFATTIPTDLDAGCPARPGSPAWRRTFHALIARFALLAAAGMSNAGAAAEASGAGSALRVEQGRFVGEDGRIVVPRGFNLAGYRFVDAAEQFARDWGQTPAQWLDELQRHGVNFLYLSDALRVSEANADELRRNLGWLLEQCEGRGIHVVLTLDTRSIEEARATVDFCLDEFGGFGSFALWQLGSNPEAVSELVPYIRRTAPSDDALRRDIELAQAAGFNGARLHQKVFEPRFHYWADKLGYLTWGEASSWGCNAASFEGRDNFLREWREIVLRDRNHPSIITWTPWNEMWWVQNEEQFGRTLRETYALTRALDPTRPVNTASGGAHCRTDIWSVHSYEQAGAGLTRVAGERQDGNLARSQKALGDARPYAGQPLLLDEFGGIKWQPEARASDAWGYGDSPETVDAFYARLEELVEAALALPDYAGYCYTQLTDVEQEVNGIYGYDRSNKFDMERIRAIFSRSPGAAHE